MSKLEWHEGQHSLLTHDGYPQHHHSAITGVLTIAADGTQHERPRQPEQWRGRLDVHEPCGIRFDGFAPPGCPDPGAHRRRPLDWTVPDRAGAAASAEPAPAIPFPVLTTHDKVLLIQFTRFEDRQLFRQWLTEAATWEAFSAYAARQS